MRTRAWWGLGAAGAVAVIMMGRGEPDLATGDHATDHLVDRLWIERMPEDSRDKVGKLAVVRSLDHGRFGVAEYGSVWSHYTEVFQWRLQGSELDTRWPQDGKQLPLEVHTYECEGQAPEPFELCLDVVAPGDAFTLYSRYDWVIRPRADGDELVDDPITRPWAESIRRALGPASGAEPPAWDPAAPTRPALWRDRTSAPR